MNAEHLFSVVVQIVVLLFAVSFHESAHGWVAMKCGDNTARDLGRISLNPLRHIDPVGSVIFPLVLALANLPVFGWAKPVPISLRGVPNPRRANLLISAAGPLSNALLAACFAIGVVVIRMFGAPGGSSGVITPLFLVAALSVIVNVSLAVFNLIPIPPLDGFGVLESVLPASLYPAALWLRRFGFVILFALIYLNVLRPVFTFFLNPVYRWLGLA